MIKKIIPMFVMILLVVSLVSASEYFELLGSTGSESSLYVPYNEPRIIGDVAYMGAYDDYYISTWNISDPSNIVELDYNDDFGAYVLDIAMKQYDDGEIYLYAVGDDYIWSHNVTNPSNIATYDDDYDSNDYAEYIQIEGDIAYSVYSSLYLHNISEKGKTIYISDMEITGYSYDFHVRNMQGGTYVIASVGSNLRIINVTNSSNPYEVSYVALDGSGSQGLDVAGNIVYINSESPNERLHSINISDLSNPSVMSYVNTSEIDSAYHIRFYDNIVYSASYLNDKVVSYDVTDPYNMVFLDEISGAGNPNYLDGAWRISVQDHSRIYVGTYNDYSLTILSHCKWTCKTYDLCQPDVAGGYLECSEVESIYCTVGNYTGNYSEFLTSCNYCIAIEEETIAECEINPETEYQSYRKNISYILTNNETCCGVTGNFTDCETSNSYWEDCGISGITGGVVANDPVYRATDTLISVVLVIVVLLFIIVGAYHNMKGKSKGEFLK